MIVYDSKPCHTYMVPGQPIPAARPRLSQRVVYDPQKALKSHWAIALEYQREKQPFYTKTPLHLIANFYFQIPASYTPSKRTSKIGKPFIHKGDIDNLAKFVMDNCNAILFDDDCTVFMLTASKYYDEKPRTEFALIPMSE